MAEKLFDYENEEEIAIAFPLFAAATGNEDDAISFDTLKGGTLPTSFPWATRSQSTGKG